eukprot:CAMPEP_0179196160 /NCGR_PEP_ID=MMETSP0796-20121207/97530_1 /TAXON_ID=73915 /ORGANISM="Pyrodinium bahamense, Strain pbaha01" /LENGTH=143 /DNA_ID=CAMNT_0020900549 /DNA_START=438 /DNA_END=866 /DNA_ORIENTATION=-
MSSLRPSAPLSAKGLLRATRGGLKNNGCFSFPTRGQSPEILENVTLRWSMGASRNGQKTPQALKGYSWAQLTPHTSERPDVVSIEMTTGSPCLSTTRPLQHHAGLFAATDKASNWGPSCAADATSFSMRAPGQDPSSRASKSK